MVHICHHQPALLSLGNHPIFPRREWKCLEVLTVILGVKNWNVVFLSSEFKTLQLLDQAKFQAHTCSFLFFFFSLVIMGFPGSSAGKESACNTGDPSLIPGSGRSAGEGIGYSLQYSWASLVAQMVKDPSATQETWVWSLGWEDPLEKGKAIHSRILTWRISWTV